VVAETLLKTTTEYSREVREAVVKRLRKTNKCFDHKHGQGRDRGQGREQGTGL
jgi:hypothetical protein